MIGRWKHRMRDEDDYSYSIFLIVFALCLIGLFV